VITELMSAINGVKTISGMLKTALDANTYLAVNKVLVDSTDKMLAAQGVINGLQAELAALDKRVVALDKEKDDLEQEVTRLGQWIVDRENYQLKEFAPGAFAYAFKPKTDVVEETAELVHLLCCQCYDASHKSILQFAGWDGSHRVHACHRCKARILERVESAGVTVQTVGRGRNRLDGFL